MPVDFKALAERREAGLRELRAAAEPWAGRFLQCGACGTLRRIDWKVAYWPRVTECGNCGAAEYDPLEVG